MEGISFGHELVGVLSDDDKQLLIGDNAVFSTMTTVVKACPMPQAGKAIDLLCQQFGLLAGASGNVCGVDRSLCSVSLTCN